MYFSTPSTKMDRTNMNEKRVIGQLCQIAPSLSDGICDVRSPQ